MTDDSKKRRAGVKSNSCEADPQSADASLREWCLAALDSAPGNVLSLGRLCDICRGSAAAAGEEDVEPIDKARIALVLVDETDWELVCRPAADSPKRAR